jgi:hypothetical protein
VAIRTFTLLLLGALLALPATASAGAPKPERIVYRVTTFAKLRAVWTAGPAATACRVGGSGVVQASLQYRTPTYVLVVRTGSKITLRPMDRAGRNVVPGPVAWRLEADVSASNLSTGAPAECAGQIDATGCGRTEYREANADDPLLTIRRVAASRNDVSVGIAGARFVPRQGACFLAGYADFGRLGTPNAAKPLVAKLPRGVASLPQFTRKLVQKGTFALADEANSQVTFERTIELVFGRVRTL